MSLKPINMRMQGIYLYESEHQAGEVVDEHHHQIHQILYVLEGEGTLTLNKEKHELSQNHVAFLIPFSNLSIVYDSNMTIMVLAFDEHQLNSNTAGDLLKSHFQDAFFSEVNPLAGNEIRQIFRRMLLEQTREDCLAEHASTVYLNTLLLYLARNRQTEPISDSNSLRAERIRHYMDNHYFEKLNVEYMADRMGITVRYVNDIFKAQYGMTPTQYLCDLRMESAQKMLIETDKDIVSIAFEVGYETLSTFYRNFKSYLHTSPHHFRQMYHMYNRPTVIRNQFRIRESNSRAVT